MERRSRLPCRTQADRACFHRPAPPRTARRCPAVAASLRGMVAVFPVSGCPPTVVQCGEGAGDDAARRRRVALRRERDGGLRRQDPALIRILASASTENGAQTTSIASRRRRVLHGDLAEAEVTSVLDLAVELKAGDGVE